jgi:hypothetical protein
LKIEISLVPDGIKKKYGSEIKGFEDQIIKLKKNYYDLRLSRNKTNKFEDNVKLIF